MNLIEKQADIDKIYFYAKDPLEAKDQYLINVHKNVGISHHDDPEAYIEYSNDMQDFYKNIDEYNLDEDNKNLIVFEDVIADIINKVKFNSNWIVS